MVWGNLGYIFGFDYISYGLSLLRIWVCVLIITASEKNFTDILKRCKTVTYFVPNTNKINN
jgi:hypothetical protein